MTTGEPPPPEALEAAPRVEVGAAPPAGAGHAGLRWDGDGALRRESAPAWGGEAAGGARSERASARRAAGARSWRGPRQATVLDGLALASMPRRGVAWAVDLVLKLLLFVTVLWFAGIEPPATGKPPEGTVLAAWAMLSIGFDWIFFATGWSPGLRLLRMRIVRADDGREPGARRGLLRASGSVLSQIPLGIGFVGIGHLWAAWHPRRQTWHDMIARTYVVVVPPAERPRR